MINVIFNEVRRKKRMRITRIAIILVSLIIGYLIGVSQAERAYQDGLDYGMHLQAEQETRGTEFNDTFLKGGK